jgi:hypothetical protein
MIPFSTKAVPLGCVVALLGVFCHLATVFCVYGLFQASKSERVNDLAPEIQKLTIIGAGSLIAGLALIVLGFKMAMASDMRDPGTRAKRQFWQS